MTQSPTANPNPQHSLYCPKLPLTVYREVAAHLRQVTGVEVGLFPQRSPEFDYARSQVGGLWIRYTDEADAASQRRVEQILAYYADRYGDWEAVQ
jgi:hypothetical protein